MKNTLSRNTDNNGDTRHRTKTKQKHNSICVGHRCTQAKTINVNRTWALQETTGDKDEPKIICMPLFFMCLYQARKYIIVLAVSIFRLFLRFFNWILKLFRQYSIFCFSFINYCYIHILHSDTM